MRDLLRATRLGLRFTVDTYSCVSAINLITAKMTAKKQRVAAEECGAALEIKFDAKRCIAAMRGRKNAAYVILCHCTRAGDADAVQ